MLARENSNTESGYGRRCPHFVASKSPGPSFTGFLVAYKRSLLSKVEYLHQKNWESNIWYTCVL